MIRIQPISIKAQGNDSYIVRFKRLAPYHSDCGVSEYERANGFVEYPFKYEIDEDGNRSGIDKPKQYFLDTHDDGSGALWLNSSVSLLDKARWEGIQLSSGAIYRPREIILHEINESFEQQYLVVFDCDDSTNQCPFTVAGNDQQLNIKWKDREHKANHGQRWTLEDKTDRSAEGKLALSIAMLHAARNFIYGPDKEWEPANA